MLDIVFQQISPRCGSQNNTFEELCCQLVHKDIPKGASYTRLNGAGGDGGVECYIEDQSGNLSGWQAKYIFDIDSLLKQLTKSLNMALKIHSNLTRYYICFPFNLTGKTGRKGKGSKEKFDNWCQEQIKQAKDSGRNIEIIGWSESIIRELLVKHDVSGGIREYFFYHTILTEEWFSNHIELIKAKAKPRYTPELNIETKLTKWFSAFGRTPRWSSEFTCILNKGKKAKEQFLANINKLPNDQYSLVLPNDIKKDGEELVNNLEIFINNCECLIKREDHDLFMASILQINDILKKFKTLESMLVEKLESEHGKGVADSQNFRQYMAEYMVSFPASNLDCTRKTIDVLSELHDWLLSPECSLANEQIFILSGGQGIGKTHCVCDIAINRITTKYLTCVAFGHEFSGNTDPWIQLLDSLGISHSLGKEGLLDLLETAGEASGFPLLLCIDAINETKPLSYWKDRIAPFITDIRSRLNIKLCITCKTTYIPYCLLDNLGIPCFKHRGFENMEHIACQVFKVLPNV